MGVLSMSGEYHKLSYPAGLPGSHQVVEHAVQRLAPDAGASGKRPGGAGVDAEFEGWGTKHLEFCREIVGQALDDNGVTAQGQVGAMLLRRPDRQDEARIAPQMGPDRLRRQELQP